MAEIKLPSGHICVVDDEDVERVSALRLRTDGRYIGASVRGGKEVKLHRFIMNAPDGMTVDHVNRDAFDNRKANLRICTQSQNLGNSGKRKRSISKYKGVTKWYRKWRARAQGRDLGLYDTQEEAAMAYDIAAVAIWGEFARPNFPR